MGLDQYAEAFVRVDNIEEVIYDSEYREDHADLIQSWRKHPNLHGWMKSLFIMKGGEGSFNCVPVELTLSDLDMLEDVVDKGKLPSTSGFFFGDDADDDYKEEDLEFIKNAREAIANGKVVYYWSWF